VTDVLAFVVRSQKREAISITEVVVVVGILGIVAGMTVAAVHQAQISANRVACQNNLFQIGRAVHGYVDQHGYFPSAFPVPTTATDAYMPPTWGWGATLLPFLDQEPLYEIAGVATKPFGGGQPNSFTQTKLAIYRCASDGGPDLNPVHSLHATSNYRAVSGPSWTRPGGAKIGEEGWGGVIFPNSKISPDQIADGLSNTVAIGECADNINEPVGRCTSIWAGQCGGVARGYFTDVMGNGGYEDSVKFSVPVINNALDTGFASYHPGGAFFLFCDGAVHFVTNELGGEMFARMAGRNDGLQVTIPE
jgi:type II secretory pathway pseudopilin PulG